MWEEGGAETHSEQDFRVQDALVTQHAQSAGREDEEGRSNSNKGWPRLCKAFTAEGWEVGERLAENKEDVYTRIKSRSPSDPQENGDVEGG